MHVPFGDERVGSAYKLYDSFYFILQHHAGGEFNQG
ncbi:hypothetical protein AVEN_239628-1, partial [Araneus ventricosus]